MVSGQTAAGMKRLFLCLALLLAASLPGHTEELARLEGRDVAVLCAPGLIPEAREVVRLYPSIRRDLEAAFRWEIDFRPVIVLVGERGVFRQMAGHEAFVAYAVPDEQVMVIDLTRMRQRPFTLEITIRHELCHLLLHRYMGSTDMPKWLDEGIAQWISEGVPELVTPARDSLLTQAALAGSLPRLESLSRSFPRDGQGLALAYGQSRSVVEYIVNNYGRNGVLNLLESLRRGASFEDAVEATLLEEMPEIEQGWRDGLLGPAAVIAYLVAHLYTILFILAALLTVWAYIRFLARKRRLRDEPEDEAGGPTDPHAGTY
ncbi:MAG TPA: peptidase MA family metallohydrolase [Deltaproteobacteria bacterium]|nr:peptidase MA family metallohydrolase [Deltaproteobacteria bacterium]HOI07260.1 peptidase MA family metallohydrolase [Deltaproteobacteria bacterium]